MEKKCTCTGGSNGRLDIRCSYCQALTCKGTKRNNYKTHGVGQTPSTRAYGRGKQATA